MKIVWSERADTDFEAALLYLEEHSPSGAKRIADRIYQSVSLLENFPLIAPPSPHPGLRELAVPSTPYIVVYRVHADLVEIGAIIHGKEQRRR